MGRAGAAMVDQVLSSGTGLLLVVLVAREATPATFGALSVALVVNGLALGINRSAVGEVVVLRLRSQDHDPVRTGRLGLGLAVVSGLVTAVALGLAGAVIGGEVGTFLGLIAVAAPAVHAQDLHRHVAYGTGRVDHAIALDGTWMAVQGAASAALIASSSATPARLVAAWAAGAACSALVGSVRHRRPPAWSGVEPWWREQRSRSLAFVTDFLVSTGLVQMSFVALSILLPLDEFGALRVAFVSMSPLANLLAGVRALTLAHLAGLAHLPTQALVRAIQVAAAFVAASAIYGTSLVLLPDRWGAELFGETWAEAAPLIAVVAVGEVLRLSTFGAIDLVKVLGPPRALVQTRTVAAAGVVVGLLLGAAVAGPRGAAACMAAGYAIATVIWWRQASSVARTAQQVPVSRT